MIKKILLEECRERYYFGSEKVDAFFALPYEEQLKEYFYHRGASVPSMTILQYQNSEDFLGFEKTTVAISSDGEKFFTKKNAEGSFVYNKKTKRVYSTYSRDEILIDLSKLPRFDWLKKATGAYELPSRVLSNSIVRDILLGKLTNAEYVVKAYLKTLHIKNVEWKTYVKFLNSDYFKIPIKWLETATTDVNSSMKLLAGENNEKSTFFKDMIFEALSLAYKINPSWSEKRMHAEHSKMTAEIMKIQKELSAQPVYSSVPQFLYPCTLLNKESEVFQEGLDMHHCIHTCYWPLIKTYKYLGLSFTYPERFTLGLKKTEAGFVFDQAYCKYNNHLSNESKRLVDTFLADEKVCDMLNSLQPATPLPEYIEAA